MTNKDRDFARTKAVVDQPVANGTLPGASIMVIHKGEPVLTYATGLARLDPPVRATTESVWAIASITKPISAVALLKQVDRGAFSLDQPVAEILPEFAPGKEKVLVRHLVSHASGMGHEFPDEDDLARFGWVGALGRMPLFYEPGTSTIYSTAAFEIVKALVVQSSGCGWTDFLNAEIFGPVGMTSTTFCPDPSLGDRLAVVYNDDGTTDNWANDPDEQDLEMAGRGLYSTLDDFVAFGKALVDRNNSLLSPETYDEMTRLQTPGLRDYIGGNIVTWGLGWYLNRDGRPNGFGRYLSERAFGHGGATTTRLTIDPENELVLAFMSNRIDMTFDQETLEARVADAVMQDLGLAAKPRY